MLILEVGSLELRSFLVPTGSNIYFWQIPHLFFNLDYEFSFLTTRFCCWFLSPSTLSLSRLIYKMICCLFSNCREQRRESAAARSCWITAATMTGEASKGRSGGGREGRASSSRQRTDVASELELQEGEPSPARRPMTPNFRFLFTWFTTCSTWSRYDTSRTPDRFLAASSSAVSPPHPNPGDAEAAPAAVAIPPAPAPLHDLAQVSRIFFV